MTTKKRKSKCNYTCLISKTKLNVVIFEQNGNSIVALIQKIVPTSISSEIPIQSFNTHITMFVPFLKCKLSSNLRTFIHSIVGINQEHQRNIRRFLSVSTLFFSFFLFFFLTYVFMPQQVSLALYFNLQLIVYYKRGLLQILPDVWLGFTSTINEL